MEGHPKWNFQEFCAFLLIYAASADMELKEEEFEFIYEKVGREDFKSIYQTFDKLTDYERIQIILTYKGLYFPNMERKRELLHLIKKQFLSDHEFSIMEQNLFRLLNKLM